MVDNYGRDDPDLLNERTRELLHTLGQIPWMLYIFMFKCTFWVFGIAWTIISSVVLKFRGFILIAILLGSIGIYAQANQSPIISVATKAALVVDMVWNDYVARLTADAWYCATPVCKGFNSIMRYIMFIIQLIKNLIEGKKRSVYETTDARSYMHNTVRLIVPPKSGTHCYLEGKHGNLASRSDCGPQVHNGVCTACGVIIMAVGVFFDLIEWFVDMAIDLVNWIVENAEDFANIPEALFWWVFNQILSIPCFNDPIEVSMAECICSNSTYTDVGDIIINDCLTLGCLFNGNNGLVLDELPQGILNCMGLKSEANMLLNCFSDMGDCVTGLVGGGIGGVVDNIGDLLGRRKRDVSSDLMDNDENNGIEPSNGDIEERDHNVRATTSTSICPSPPNTASPSPFRTAPPSALASFPNPPPGHHHHHHHCHHSQIRQPP
jgi:hypothetical protein